MAIDTHIKFDGVSGESTQRDHKGEIEVLSWSWSATSHGLTTGAGSGAGKCEPGQFTFQHTYDKASPLLAKQCASGKFFKEVALTSAKAGEGQKDFLKVTMKEVIVASIQPSGSDGGIQETVSLSYKDIEFAYKPQDEKGALGAEVKFGWNVATSVVR